MQWRLVVGALMAACTVALAQPPGYVADDAVGGTDLKIALIWGDQLKPSAEGMKAVTNLRRAAVQAGLRVGAEDQVRISSANLSQYAALFVITDQLFQLSDTEKKKLRDFIDKGGLIVLDDAAAAMPASPSGASFTAMIADVTGAKRLQPLSNDHEIYRKPNMLGGPPLGSNVTMTTVGQTELPDGKTKLDNKVMAGGGSMLSGVTRSGRLVILLGDRGYCKKWGDYSDNEAQLKFGVNLIAYALASRK